MYISISSAKATALAILIGIGVLLHSTATEASHSKMASPADGCYLCAETSHQA